MCDLDLGVWSWMLGSVYCLIMVKICDNICAKLFENSIINKKNVRPKNKKNTLFFNMTSKCVTFTLEMELDVGLCILSHHWIFEPSNLKIQSCLRKLWPRHEKTLYYGTLTCKCDLDLGDRELIMVNICAKFFQKVLNSLKVMEWTWMLDRQPEVLTYVHLCRYLKEKMAT